MTKDRLTELKAFQDVEAQDAPVEGAANTTTDEFLKEVDSIWEILGQITEDAEKVKKAQLHILSYPVSDEQMKNELEQAMNDLKQVARKVKERLAALERGIKEDSAAQVPFAHLKIKRNHYTVLSRKFVDVMTAYQKAEVEYKDKCKERIKRHLKVVGTEVDDEQIEQMLDSGKPSVFTQGIITDTLQAKQMLADVEARHKDILSLEASIRELQEMFLDVAMLVQSQGEMVDRIEFNVETAAVSVAKAAVETKAAVVYQKKARRKKFCLFVCIIILIGVVAIVIVASVCGTGKC